MLGKSRINPTEISFLLEIQINLVRCENRTRISSSSEVQNLLGTWANNPQLTYVDNNLDQEMNSYPKPILDTEYETL